MRPLTRAIVDRFARERDPVRAEPMRRYMRDQFPFLGIGTPARRAAQREILASGRPDREEVVRVARELWERDEREFQYAACDLLAAAAARLEPADLAVVRELVTTKSWWDTVDPLAIHVAGAVVLADRTSGDVTMDEWSGSDDLWLVRSAILHQNRWKAQTDEGRLFAFCFTHARHPDFFVRKAIGWALREYSKVAPDAVRRFVAEHDAALSTLSKREALKRLGTPPGSRAAARPSGTPR